MSWSLYTLSGTPITLAPGLPPGYRGLLLPGARLLSGRWEQALIVRQEVALEQCRLQLGFFEFSGGKPQVLGRLHSPQLQLRLQLRGSFCGRLDGLGKIALKESQHALVGLPPTECSATYQQGRASQSLDIIYPDNLLGELAAYFPRLQKPLAAYAAGKPSTITPPGRWSSGTLLRLVEDLLCCPFDDRLRRVYLENKVRELLLLQLYEAFDKAPAGAGPFTRREVEAAYEVRRLILSDLEQHRSIAELARRVGLNEFALKAVFKQVFGTGPFECLLQARMDRARNLLVATDQPIKAIAAGTGYRYLTSFITAFRKYYGCTPGELRRGS